MKMHIIEIKNLKEAEEEFNKIKPDKKGIGIMAPKAVFRIVKIKDLRPTPSNILKQEMLSQGGEAVCERGVINNSTLKSDILLLGTLRQFDGLIAKLKQHQFGLPQLAEEIKNTLSNYDKTPKLRIGRKILPLGKKTYIMGILNVTPDSFYDGGKFSGSEAAIAHAEKMIEEGADIIDVGGESTRPGSQSIGAKEEIRRVVPIIKKISGQVVVSIDTYKSETASAALEAGAKIVNDISGLHFDKKMAKIVKQFNASLVLMHIRGTPKNMQKNPVYLDLISEIIDYIKEGLEIANNAGILNDRIIIDPGFGFGKTVEHNLLILRRLREFKSLGLPILIGTSRKSAIGRILGLPAEKRLEGTAATMSIAIQNGADIIRVHDTAEMKMIAKMTDTIIRRV